MEKNTNPFLGDGNTLVEYQVLDEGQFVDQYDFGVSSDVNDDYNSAISSPRDLLSPVDVVATIEDDNNVAGASATVGDASNPPAGGQTSSNIDKKISRLVDAVEKIVVTKNDFDGGKVDLRHIDNFSGDGESSLVAINLENFVKDMEEAFRERTFSEHQKLLLAKQKLTKSARTTINAQRPSSYTNMVEILRENFGGNDDPHEHILDQLKHFKIFPNQNFTQFSLKALELANLVSSRLECEVKTKIVFEALAKGLLSNFKDHITTQSEVKVALKERNPDKLISTLKELTKTDPQCLIKPGAHNVNKIVSKQDKKMDVTTNKDKITVKEPEVKCQLCKMAGHLAPSCPSLKADADNNKNNFANNQYRGPSMTYNPFHYANYYHPQEYQGRTPRFYQPRAYYRPRYRYFAPSRHPSSRNSNFYGQNINTSSNVENSVNNESANQNHVSNNENFQ